MPSDSTPSRRSVLAGAGLLLVGGAGGYRLRGRRDRTRAAPPHVAPTDWPHPDGDAARTRRVSPENAPDELERRWLYETGELGLFGQSPVVANGTVFLAESDEIPSPALRAFSLGDGREQWSVEASGGAIAAAGDRLYHCYDGRRDVVLDARSTADGSLLWRVSEGYSGFPGTPLVDDGRVHLGSFDRLALAYDAGDGSTLWKAVVDRDTRAGAQAVGESLLACTTDDGIAAFDAESGESRWQSTFAADPGSDRVPSPSGAPIVADDRVFAATHALSLVAFNAESGAVDWRVQMDPTENVARRYEPGAYADGVLYAVEEQYNYFPDVLHAFDAATGDRRWTFPAGESGDVSLSAPTVCDGSVYCTRTHADDATRANELLRLDAGNGALVDGAPLESSDRGAPVVAGGAVVLAGSDRVEVLG